MGGGDPGEVDQLARAVSDPDTVRAAGAVLWRRIDAGGSGAGDVEVALVHRSRHDDWSLPKGKLQDGEPPLLAGCREVLEETGHRPVVGVRLPSTRYKVTGRGGGLVPKVVDYWAMHASGGTFDPNDEVDELCWLAPGPARTRLSYGHDRTVLDAFGALPSVTATVLLVRHARAGDRKRWRGPDDLRPLDPTGREQAARLASVLPYFAPEQVVSADRVRCTETVGPLAAALGLTIELDPAFDEGAHATDPGRAAVRLRELARQGRTVAVCSQGGVIPDTVHTLAHADRLSVRSAAARKGSVWVLSFAGDTLVAADHLAPTNL